MAGRILIQKEKTTEEKKYFSLWKNWDKYIQKHSEISRNSTVYNHKYTGMKDINKTIFPFYHISKTDTVISCGCARWYLHNGMSHPFIFSTMVKKVFLFEADPLNLSAIKTYIGDNNIKNISLIPKAVFDKNGDIEFSSYKNTPGGSNKIERYKEDISIEVNSTTLDSQLEKESIQHLHLTINGVEYQALKGATKILESKPSITIAMIDKEHKMFNRRKPAIEMLYNMGYYIGWARGCTRFSNDFWFAIATMDKDKLLSLGYSSTDKLFPV